MRHWRGKKTPIRTVRAQLKGFQTSTVVLEHKMAGQDRAGLGEKATEGKYTLGIKGNGTSFPEHTKRESGMIKRGD